MTARITTQPSTNGKAKRMAIATPTPKAKDKPRRKGKKWTTTQHLAVVVGVVACCVLALSVAHCQEALNLLMGMPTIAACLLAVAIDVGMVACECCGLYATGKGKQWAERYVLVAIVLSMALNAYASAQHASGWLAIGLSIVVGVIIPALVLILGKVACHCWKE